MKKGESINGYEILRDFTTAGGGLSKWTFARKRGNEYFLKEFLAPTYPVDGAPGSARTKAQKLRRCAAFEKHHRDLMDRLSSKSKAGGNLIVTVDFFRSGAKYYKVTDKIDTHGLSVEDITASSLEKKRLVMLTVAHSLRIIHDSGVVHGDLKPDNILIKNAEKGFVAKLIDFDNSYLSRDPPEASEELVGDIVYYSPEMLRYIKNDESLDRRHLQVKSDIFALGLVYSEFLTGRLPHFDRDKYRYACEAVVAGTALAMDGMEAPGPMRTLLASMLQAEVDSRPSISEVFTTIKSWAVSMGEEAPGKTAAPTGLRGTLVAKRSLAAAAGAGTSAPAAPSSSARPGLRGTLIKRTSK